MRIIIRVWFNSSIIRLALSSPTDKRNATKRGRIPNGFLNYEQTEDASFYHLHMHMCIRTRAEHSVISQFIAETRNKRSMTDARRDILLDCRIEV